MKEGLGTPTIVEFVTDPQLLGLNLSPALVEEVIAASGGLAIQRFPLTYCFFALNVMWGKWCSFSRGPGGV